MSRERKALFELCEKLEKLDYVTKSLQCDTTTLADARLMFDCVIEECPITSTRLSSSASIVHQPDFETGIMKTQEGDIVNMDHACYKSFMDIGTSSIFGISQ